MLGVAHELGSSATPIDLAKADEAYMQACKLRTFKGCEEAQRLRQRQRAATPPTPM